MAVVAKRRKSGKVAYYVVTRWRNKLCWELSGNVRRDAESLDAQRKREKKAGVFQPPRRIAGIRLTIRGYVDEVAELRKKRSSARDPEREMSWVRRHVCNRSWLADIPMQDVRPRMCDRLVHELRTNTIDGKPAADRKPLKDKSINNVLHGLRTMFRTAVREELIENQPVELEPRMLRLSAHTEREIYAPAEVRALLDHESLPHHERVLIAMAFYTGMRNGEICGRRVRDIIDAPGLLALNVDSQYDGLPLKTDNPRTVPIHPELRDLLSDWLENGFALYAKRAPRPDDFIVPNKSPWANCENHTKKTLLGVLKRACSATGVTYRSLHSTRHTFTSVARRAGVSERALGLITHNPRGRIIDVYTHTDWEPLCDVIRAVKFDVRQTLHFVRNSTSKQRVATGLSALRKHAKGNER